MIKKITKQAAFTLAVQGLYAQEKPATNGNGYCQYRDTINGFKCGVGFLIPDSIYHKRFESLSAIRLFETVPAFKELFEPGMDKNFLNNLQTDLHDNYVEYAEDENERNQEPIPYKKWLVQAAEDFASLRLLEMPELSEGVSA